MGEALKYFTLPGGQGDQLGTGELLFAMTLSCLCLLVICFVYRLTHKTVSYSQSYVHSLILTGLVTTLIMVVIGSNIARAFSLVGALSIIRFRNAIKETRDVGYIFFAIAIAMACGTRFYGLAVLATFAISSVMILMYIFDFGSGQKNLRKFLTIQMPPIGDPETLLEPILNRFFSSFQLVTMQTVRQGLYTELHYSVFPKGDPLGTDIIAAFHEVNDHLKVTYTYRAHLEDL